MKLLKFAIFLIMLQSGLFLRAQINILSFDTSCAATVIRDSVYYKQKLWGKFGVEKEDEVKFIVIPLVDFTKDADKYDSLSSLLNYIKVLDNSYYAFVLNKEKYIGSIEIEYTPQENENIYDTAENNKDKDYYINKLYGANLDAVDCKWNLSIHTVFPNTSELAFKNSKKFYEVSKEKKYKCFLFKRQKWELWFVNNNELYAYTIENQLYKESELISGIKKVNSNGMTYYIFEYKQVF